MKNKTYLLSEFLFLFFLVPFGLYFFDLFRYFLPILLLFALTCFFYIKKSNSYSKEELFSFKYLNRDNLKKVIFLFSLSIIPLIIFVYFFAPERLVAFPLEKPIIWLLVMIFYPILSVYPQEIIFRAFIFQRYKTVFANSVGMIFASAIAFGFVHIIFQNFIAIFLSTIGGIIFGYSFLRTRSLILVSFEHAIYGCYVFTIGLGWYFYRGSVGIN